MCCPPDPPLWAPNPELERMRAEMEEKAYRLPDEDDADLWFKEIKIALSDGGGRYGPDLELGLELTR